MRLLNALAVASAFTQCTSAVAVPNPVSSEDNTLQSRADTNEHIHSERSSSSSNEELWKRKGGGGSGGRGGGSSGGSSGSGSSGSSGSSSSGGRGSSGSSTGSGSSGSSGGGGRTSGSSGVGGATSAGSGPKPAYGAGGLSYGGGSRTPYRAGGVTAGGIVPGLLIGSALGFWGTYWLLGAYSYPYHNPYSFRNASANRNETKPVQCLCRTDQECGCEDNSADTQYMNGLIGNGSYDGLNKSLITVANVNGTDTIFINGSLPNGTTAAGGTDDEEDTDSAAAHLQMVGWWPIAAAGLAMAYIA